MTKLALSDFISPRKYNLFNSITIQSIFYILLLCANVGLVWSLPYFPTQDGPSHIYNLVILRDLLNGGKDWGTYFSYDLKAVPNLGFYLIAYPLLSLFSPFVAEKLFVSIFILLLGSSVPFYISTFEKPALPLSYFVFPVIFNFNLMMGFYSYVIAIPFLLFGISISWRIKDKSPLRRFLILNATGLVIYCVHLIPYCLYLLSVYLIPMSRTNNFKNSLKSVVFEILVMLPAVLALISYLLTGINTDLEHTPHLYSFVHFLKLIVALPLFSMDTFSRWQIVPWIVFFFMYFLHARCTVFKKIKPHLLTGTEKYILMLTGCVVTIYLVMPAKFASGDCFNQRFPWVILLMSLPALNPAFSIASRITSTASSLLFKSGAKPPSSPTPVL